MSTQTKLAIGSVMATFGALSIVLSLLLEWSLPRPWGSLLGLVVLLITIFGATLAIAGLIERKRDN